MKCKTQNKKEIEKFIEGAVSYALSEQCTGRDICWCNRCRMGGGRLEIGGVDHQRFMHEHNLWKGSEEHPLNQMGLGILTQPLAVPVEKAGEIIRKSVEQGVWYQTGTGKGTYTMADGILTFDGFRGSFCGGCEVFSASREGGWELIESTRPEWGVFGEMAPEPTD